MHIKTEGLIIHTLKFNDHDQIVTLFSPLGLIKLIVKKCFIAKKGNLSSLTQVECICRRNKSEIFSCKEFTTLNSFLPLRKNFSLLQSAGKMMQSIYQSQKFEKPSPLLYQLFLSYLKWLDNDCFQNLVTSFKLKILRHDGLLSLLDQCCFCQNVTQEYFLYKGENFCKNHAPSQAIFFSALEKKILRNLSFSRSQKQLKTTLLTPTFAEKVEKLFVDLIDS